MNITAHLIRKDWERLRPALLAWYALIAGKAWCLWRLLHSGDVGSNFELLGSFVNMLNGLELAAGALLAAQLALEDPVHRPHAFWPTRPISRRSLLRAKSLGALLFFIAAPLLLLAPVWLVAGFSAPEFFAAAAGWTLLQGLFVAAGLLSTALARDVGQASLGALLLGFTFLATAFWFRREPGTPLWLFSTVGLAVLCGALPFAYLLRRRLAALAFLAGFGLLLAGFGLPVLPSSEHLTAWPVSTESLHEGGNLSAASRSWRFVARDYDDKGRPTLLLQTARPWFGFHPRPQASERASFFHVEVASTGLPARIVPERLGTVQAASLRVTRWHLPLPDDFKSPAGGLRLLGDLPTSSAPQP